MTDPRHTARTLIEQHAVTLEGLWIQYWGEGENASIFEFDAYLYGVLERPPYELDILAWAMEDLEESSARRFRWG